MHRSSSARALHAPDIDNLTERVLAMQGTQKGLTWFLTSIVLVAAGVSIAKDLGWM